MTAELELHLRRIYCQCGDVFLLNDGCLCKTCGRRWSLLEWITRRKRN